ncbi:MAG: hypothetical protein HPZ91_17660 [Lentisphaeria bacterium]|nr:hypothetical protein [Lentisphaeria bacterium]
MEFSEKFALYRVFTSHMVLQRERPIVFSGTAEPGRGVRVTFAGKSVEAVAGQDHEWSAEFPPMEAGGPYAMTVSGADGAAPLELDDILIGEVWMCTGQSNMEMPVDSASPFFRVLNPAEELKHADNPRIRLFNAMLTRRLAPNGPLNDVGGPGWQPCNAKSAADFSACGYFFGRRLEKDLDVPVGLIATAWGGTDIASWISHRKFEEMHWTPLADSGSGTENEAWKNRRENENFRELAGWLDRFEACGDSGASVAAAEFDDSGWEECGDVVPLPRPGRYACRISFDLPAGFAGKELKLKLGSINDSDRTWFNGELIGATGVETPGYWSVPREYMVPGRCVRAGRNCIAVIADNHYGAGGISTYELEAVCGGDVFRIQPVRRLKTLFVLPEEFPVRPAVPSVGSNRSPYGPNYPSTLFNAMLNPWFRYAVRGTLWYQGCHNNGEFTYYPLHRMLIDDMRGHWNDPEMPFLLVQLASYVQHRPENRLPDAEVDAMPFPEFPPFAITREIQSEMPRVRKGVGMIVSFDCGDHSDVHPRDKQTLGHRLAMKAEAMVYGKKVPCDGPEFAGFRQEGAQLRVFFRNTGSGLITSDGEAPAGFVVGDRAGALCRAEARIDGDTVVVSAPEVMEPQRVRYAFTGYCRVNLMNKEGFPAVPFRSDKVDYEGMFADLP